jgi:uncharacterized protein (DUF924 family)
VPDSKDILDYWLGPADVGADEFKQIEQRWYEQDSATDSYIGTQFGETLRLAEDGQLEDWAESPDGTLALVILFDQFSRNLYRSSADAYRNDDAALDFARQLIRSDAHAALTVPAKLILYHPLHHAEDRQAQQEVVSLITSLSEELTGDWREIVDGHKRFIENHAGIVEQFGRFPHRNALLARESTAAEIEFLARDRRTYGQ